MMTFSRLDCGTGPGLVRSSQQVTLGSWNHLSVFRHDWAVWIQLNSGQREEGRSQVQHLTKTESLSRLLLLISLHISYCYSWDG